MNLQCVLPGVTVSPTQTLQAKSVKNALFHCCAEVAVILCMWLFFLYSLTSVLAKLRGSAAWCD